MIQSISEDKRPAPEKQTKNHKTLIGIFIVIFALFGIIGVYFFLSGEKLSEDQRANIRNNVGQLKSTPKKSAAESTFSTVTATPNEPDTVSEMKHKASRREMGVAVAQGNGECPVNGNPAEASSGHTQGHNMTNMPSQMSPYHHRIYSATSKDGLNWKADEKTLFDHCSVPGAVVRKGIIYVYFVDGTDRKFGLSAAISKDLGKTFTKQAVGGRMVDPHPVLLNDGTIRLYFFGFRNGFQYADSKDGINFGDPKVVYKESRESIHASNKGRTRGRMGPMMLRFTDPDVFRTDKDWRMLVSKGPELLLLISDDNGETFKMQNDFSWNRGGVSETFNFNGVYRTFYGSGGMIKSAVGADKGKLVPEPGVRIRQKGNFQLSSPSVIRLPNGTYIMYYVFHKFNPPFPPNDMQPNQGDMPIPDNMNDSVQPIPTP